MTKPILLLTLTLTACAAPDAGRPGYWDHPSQDRAQFDKDRAQCLYESAAAAAPAPTSGSLGLDVVRDMETGNRRAELLVMCLNAKGYKFVQP